MAKREHPAHIDHKTVLEGEPVEPITWTASEFIAHQKTAGWYLSLALACVLLAAIIYLITKDKISSIAVIVAGFFLGFYANRQPRQLSYQLDGHRLKVGEKIYNYQSFRSFSIMSDGPFDSIIFWPLQRFAPPISVYFDPEDGDKILELLMPRLPQEQKRNDPIDSFMRRIRF